MFPWVNLGNVCVAACAHGGRLVILKGKGKCVFVGIFFFLLLLTGEVCACLRFRLGEETFLFFFKAISD